MFAPKVDYFETEIGQEILELLYIMVRSPDYITEDSYTPHSENLIPFIDKHQTYIRKHPNTNALHYVSNLKILYRRR